MRVLMVSSYPPMKCGIGKYAQQATLKMRMNGYIVDVWSPEEGNGDYIEDLVGGSSLLKLLYTCYFYDKVVMQYHETFYYKNADSRWDRFLSHLCFIIFFMMYRKTEVVVHEISFPKHRGTRNRLGKLWDRFEQALEVLKWRVCPNLVFHSRKEIQDFVGSTSINRDFMIVKPHEHYIKQTALDKKGSREHLGVPQNVVTFLCIGFIQSHKGFDRVIRAMKEVEADNIRLYIVGSIRVAYDETLRYMQLLKDLAKDDSRVTIVEQFIDDEEFDIWIQSSDFVVVPYREIWTSGVVGRAKLFDKTVIAANVGSLEEQLESYDYMFNHDEEMSAIMKFVAHQIPSAS